MFNETQDATNIINQLDDKQAPNMSLSSNGGGIINLNGTRENYGYQHDTGQGTEEKEDPVDTIAGAEPKTPTKPKEPEVTPEKEMSHGDYKIELENIYKDIESNQELLSILEQKIKETNMGFAYYSELKKYMELPDSMSPEYFKNPEQYSIDVRNAIESKINEVKGKISNLYSREKEILSNKNYDNRTEEQIRADSSTQLKVDDYIKAGLNPAGVGGYYGSAGGGGGSSSSNDEEERKRKKREREAEAQRRKERQQDMAMKMLGMLLGTGNALGSAGIRTKGFIESAKLRNKNNKFSKNDNDAKQAWADYVKNFQFKR